MSSIRRIPRPLSVPLGPDGWPSLHVAPSLLDWSALLWSRWGSGAPFGCPLHCFVDDWRIETAWRRPELALCRAISAGLVTAPDYSVEWSDPEPYARYQVWRSRMVAAFWRVHGVRVVPVLQWGGPQTWSACALGLLPGGVVAVRGPSLLRGVAGSAAGGAAVQNEQPLSRWREGALALSVIVRPALVLHFGPVVTAAADIWQCPVIAYSLNPRATRIRDHA